jgi:hypothetical protein
MAQSDGVSMGLWRTSTSPGLASARSSSSAQPSPAELQAYAVEYPAVPCREDIWKALTNLDGQWVRTLLLRISDNQARVAWEIWQEYQKQKVRKRRRRTSDFTKAHRRRLDESWCETERRNHDPSEADSWDDLGFQVAGQEEGSFVAGSISQSNADEAASQSTVGEAFPYRNVSEAAPQRQNATVSNQQDPAPPSSTNQQHENRRADGGPPGLSLDDECRQIWFVMTREHRHKSDEGQRAVAPGVYKEVTWVIDRIREHACSRDSDFDNRRKSMEILRNVGETICSAEGTLGVEVRKKFMTDPSLEGAMVDILVSLDPIELEAMANINDCRSRFHEKLTDLCILGREHGMFQDLTAVVKVIRGEEVESGLKAEESDVDTLMKSPQVLSRSSVDGALSILEQTIAPRAAQGVNMPQSNGSQRTSASPAHAVFPQSMVSASPTQAPPSFRSLGKHPLSIDARSPNFRDHGTPEARRLDPWMGPAQSSESHISRHSNLRFHGVPHVGPSTARPNAASFLPNLFGGPA